MSYKHIPSFDVEEIHEWSATKQKVQKTTDLDVCIPLNTISLVDIPKEESGHTSHQPLAVHCKKAIRWLEWLLRKLSIACPRGGLRWRLGSNLACTWRVNVQAGRSEFEFLLDAASPIKGYFSIILVELTVTGLGRNEPVRQWHVGCCCFLALFGPYGDHTPAIVDLNLEGKISLVAEQSQPMKREGRTGEPDSEVHAGEPAVVRFGNQRGRDPLGESGENADGEDLGARQTTVSEGGMQKQRVIRGKQMANHGYGAPASAVAQIRIKRGELREFLLVCMSPREGGCDERIVRLLGFSSYIRGQARGCDGRRRQIDIERNKVFLIKGKKQAGCAEKGKERWRYASRRDYYVVAIKSSAKAENF
ncbi:hypothetical protein B0H13DRAFT_1852209 [Mycena leptocephala]|nr:hypothetical protein B0H13DRAFT_1852209 [Mycena leptocephala]